MVTRARRLEQELAEGQAEARRRRTAEQHANQARLGRIKRRLARRESRLVLRTAGDEAVLTGFTRSADTPDDLASLGWVMAFLVGFGGPLMGVWVGGPSGAGLAGSSIALAVMLSTLSTSGRTDWSLRVEGRAAELVLGPSLVNGRTRQRRVVVPVEEVRLLVDDADTDPRLFLEAGGTAIPVTRLSLGDVRQVGDFEAWLDAAKDSARSDV